MGSRLSAMENNVQSESTAPTETSKVDPVLQELVSKLSAGFELQMLEAYLRQPEQSTLVEFLDAQRRRSPTIAVVTDGL